MTRSTLTEEESARIARLNPPHARFSPLDVIDDDAAGTTPRPDHHPLTRGQVIEILAARLDGEQRNSPLDGIVAGNLSDWRLMQGIPGMTNPPPDEGPVHRKARQLRRLLADLAQNRRIEFVIDGIMTVLEPEKEPK